MIVRDHFRTDEDYDGGEALVQEAETGEHVGEDQVESAQAADGEDSFAGVALRLKNSVDKMARR